MIDSMEMEDKNSNKSKAHNDKAFHLHLEDFLLSTMHDAGFTGAHCDPDTPKYQQLKRMAVLCCFRKAHSSKHSSSLDISEEERKCLHLLEYFKRNDKDPKLDVALNSFADNLATFVQ